VLTWSSSRVASGGSSAKNMSRTDSLTSQATSSPSFMSSTRRPSSAGDTALGDAFGAREKGLADFEQQFPVMSVLAELFVQHRRRTVSMPLFATPTIRNGPVTRATCSGCGDSPARYYSARPMAATSVLAICAGAAFVRQRHSRAALLPDSMSVSGRGPDRRARSHTWLPPGRAA
jgi:hypothetical protein